MPPEIPSCYWAGRVWLGGEPRVGLVVFTTNLTDMFCGSKVMLVPCLTITTEGPEPTTFGRVVPSQTKIPPNTANVAKRRVGLRCLLIYLTDTVRSTVCMILYWSWERIRTE
jgi:hypothetical protein